MRQKTFYFVRHGESLLNSKGIRQGSDGGLSEKGKAQAQAAGQSLCHLPIDVILVSPYERTRETAAIINQSFQPPRNLEFVELLKERRNPSEIIGKSVEDPAVRRIVDTIDKAYHSDEFRFSDEENFLDLKERARKALSYLGKRREKNILVLTHGIFLRMLIAYMLYGDDLNASSYNVMSFQNGASNAGVTICQYERGWFGPPKNQRWKLISWNDHTHERGIQSHTI
ncbi:MAG: histidine phosphatase family protein [Patescibacteria group bacterium]